MSLIIKGLIGLAIIGSVTTTVVLLPDNKVEVKESVVGSTIEAVTPEIQSESVEVVEAQEQTSEPVREEVKTSAKVVGSVQEVVIPEPSPIVETPVVIQPTIEIPKPVVEVIEPIEPEVDTLQAECLAADKAWKVAQKEWMDYVAETQRLDAILWENAGSIVQGNYSSAALSKERMPEQQRLKQVQDNLNAKLASVCF